MLRRERVGLYAAMETWWIQLSDMEVPHLHRMMAEKSLVLANALLGGKLFSIRSFLTVSILSVSLTIISLFLGYWVGIIREYEIPIAFSINIISDWFSDLTSSIDSLMVFLVYFPLINLALDGLTVLITILLLRKVRRAGGFKAIAYVLIDVLASIIIGLMCFNAGAQLYELTGESLGVLGQIDRTTTIGRGFAVIFFSVTTAIPTVIYMSVMLLLVLCKLVLSISKGLTSAFLERAVDEGVIKFAPFTLFGISCGVLASLIRTAIQLLG
jgi:hypothetical protein